MRKCTQVSLRQCELHCRCANVIALYVTMLGHPTTGRLADVLWNNAAAICTSVLGSSLRPIDCTSCNTLASCACILQPTSLLTQGIYQLHLPGAPIGNHPFHPPDVDTASQRSAVQGMQAYYLYASYMHRLGHTPGRYLASAGKPVNYHYLYMHVQFECSQTFAAGAMTQQHLVYTKKVVTAAC